MVTTETTHPPWSQRFTAKRYGRGLSIEAAAQLMGVSAEEFARLEQEDPAFRAMLEEARETAALPFEEQLDRADELLLDALMSFLEGGDLRAFMRAPTILRYLRRRDAAPATSRERDGNRRASVGKAPGRLPERRPPSHENGPDPAWAAQSGHDAAIEDGAAGDRLRCCAAEPADEIPSGAALPDPDSCRRDPSTSEAGSLIPALRGVFGESEFERSLAEIAATERRLVEPQSGPELTEADWARARDTLAAAPPPPADAAEAAWIYQGPLDTYRVQRHIEKLRADHRIAHPDRVTRLGSKEFRDAAEALAPQARPP